MLGIFRGLPSFSPTLTTRPSTTPSKLANITPGSALAKIHLDHHLLYTLQLREGATNCNGDCISNSPQPATSSALDPAGESPGAKGCLSSSRITWHQGVSTSSRYVVLHLRAFDADHRLRWAHSFSPHSHQHIRATPLHRQRLWRFSSPQVAHSRCVSIRHVPPNPSSPRFLLLRHGHRNRLKMSPKTLTLFPAWLPCRPSSSHHPLLIYYRARHRSKTAAGISRSAVDHSFNRRI